MSFASDKIRQIFSQADNQRDAGLSTPEDIVRYENIVFLINKFHRCLIHIFR